MIAVAVVAAFLTALDWLRIRGIRFQRAAILSAEADALAREAEDAEDSAEILIGLAPIGVPGHVAGLRSRGEASRRLAAIYGRAARTPWLRIVPEPR